jgi:hypothetical protein
MATSAVPRQTSPGGAEAVQQQQHRRAVAELARLAGLAELLAPQDRSLRLHWPLLSPGTGA